MKRLMIATISGALLFAVGCSSKKTTSAGENNQTEMTAETASLIEKVAGIYHATPAREFTREEVGEFGGGDLVLRIGKDGTSSTMNDVGQYHFAYDDEIVQLESDGEVLRAVQDYGWGRYETSISQIEDSKLKVVVAFFEKKEEAEVQPEAAPAPEGNAPAPAEPSTSFPTPIPLPDDAGSNNGEGSTSGIPTEGPFAPQPTLPYYSKDEAEEGAEESVAADKPTLEVEYTLTAMDADERTAYEANIVTSEQVDLAWQYRGLWVAQDGSELYFIDPIGKVSHFEKSILGNGFTPVAENANFDLIYEGDDANVEQFPEEAYADEHELEAEGVIVPVGEGREQFTFDLNLLDGDESLIRAVRIESLDIFVGTFANQDESVLALQEEILAGVEGLYWYNDGRFIIATNDYRYTSFARVSRDGSIHFVEDKVGESFNIRDRHVLGEAKVSVDDLIAIAQGGADSWAPSVEFVGAFAGDNQPEYVRLPENSDKFQRYTNSVNQVIEGL